jgi:hypothetical protein
LRNLSSSSSLDFGVEAFQFRAGVFDAELPIDTALLGIGLKGYLLSGTDQAVGRQGRVQAARPLRSSKKLNEECRKAGKRPHFLVPVFLLSSLF